jgi:hypothetical protein
MPNAGDPGLRRGKGGGDFAPFLKTVQDADAPKLSKMLENMDEEDRDALEKEINRIMLKNLEGAMARAFLRGLEREKSTSFMDIPVVIDYSMAPNTFRLSDPRVPSYREQRRELRDMLDTLIYNPQSIVKGNFN